MLDLYCLTNFTDYSLAIHQPLKHSNRIKYTCFDISDNYIVLGATSGSLYIFNREGKFLLLVPSKHGAVNLLSISVNEKYVAFSTQRSVVCVYAVNLSAQAAPQVVFTNLSSDCALQVSCIHWTQEEKQFYYGDSQGHVNLVLLSTFIGTSLLNMSIHPILFLEQQPIIQIDDFEALLLVSNCFKCLLCNTEYEEYKQVGVKPRFGSFGACFFISSNEAQQPSRIFCARPGSRIWEVDFEGEVIRTHQFKHALACPPTKILKPQNTDTDNDNDNDNLSCSDSDGNDEMLDYQPQILQFRKLQKLTQDFILAHTELGLYIFDVRNSGVVLWCNQFERIVECRAMKHGEIAVFTQTGSLYTMQLQTMQHHACAMVHQSKLLECTWLMRKNVRYFAEKAREDCEFGILNRIKYFLMERHQYELLNDLSVIFDAIAQCESNGDNNSSGGSSVTAERSSSLCAVANTPAHQVYTSYSNNQIQSQPYTQNSCNPSVTTNTDKAATTITGGVDCQLPNMNKAPSHDVGEQGIYVLENAFCDNLKPHKGERHFKDALLTVTGKFGKNIIKYKFNIFQEEQQKLVEDLIPAHERSLPFKDIKAMYEPDEDIVCRSSSSTKKSISAAMASSSIQSTPNKILKYTTQHITAEEKTIYNLYLICKSSKFSNMNFVERYRTLFDEYTAPELRRLLDKLSQLMIDHGDDPKQAQRHCYEMYFQYLNPELIWEMDEQSRDYITDGFILLNASDDIVRCDNCLFPLRFHNTCQFNELGSVLLRYYWSRNEQIKCFDVLTRVPALFDVLARLYLAECNMDKVLPIILNYGQPELLIELGKNFSITSWAHCFEQFVELQQGRLTCVNCECVTNVENMNRHFFYTWNCFLSILLDYLPAQELLALLYKWSNFIPNDAIDREFYTRCMLKV